MKFMKYSVVIHIQKICRLEILKLKVLKNKIQYKQ